MENNQQQILSEIKSLMSSVRVQLEQLDAKMAQLQQMYESHGNEPIEMDFDVLPELVCDDLPFYEESPALSVDEPEPVDELVVEPVVEPVIDPVDEPVVEPVIDPVDEPVVEPVIEPVDEPEVVSEVQSEPVVEPELSLLMEPEPVRHPSIPSAPVAVIDLMATKHAWRTDMPGSPVRDVRAAIALVDRALFINALFNEDAMAFMEALNRVNQAETLDDAVDYLAQTYSHWDFDSDVVYRFMMAVRRKISC